MQISECCLITLFICPVGAGVTERLYTELPRDGPGFDSLWQQCKNRASHPSQGTVNGGAVSI